MTEVRRDAELEREAEVITRYLVGEAPGRGHVVSYVSANSVLFADADDALTAFCRRRPFWLPLVDSGAGFLDNACLLRRKILLMAAILEASTRFAPHFLPGESTTRLDLVRVGVTGAVAALRTLLGVPLVLTLRRSR